ncbi:hypothetical protein JCM16303_005556 [Sporobolomyces ruberrimus]
MNDAASVCSGLIRLTTSTRRIRSTRSTLSHPSSLRPTTTPWERTPSSIVARIVQPRVVKEEESRTERIENRTSSNSNPPPTHRTPISKPVHTEPITSTTSTPPPAPPPVVEPTPEPRLVQHRDPIPSPPPPPPRAPSITDAVEPKPIPPSRDPIVQQEEDQVVEINNLRSSKVPSSRLGRLMHYGGLAAGLGYGMASEAIRRTTYGNQGQEKQQQPGLLLSQANVERLVDKLSKMRGAALKLGQFLSIQGKPNTKLLSPQLESVLHRVQNSANYMPEWQTQRVLTQDLGQDWKSHFTTFDMRPFAAASIGQVHSATISPSSPHYPQTSSSLSSSSGGVGVGRGEPLKVAVKVQFPGVRESISSDLSNLKWLLLATAVLPRGLYLDNSLKVLERELIQECDYLREAEFGTRMRRFVRGNESMNETFSVPRVVGGLSGGMVLTTEMMFGKPIKKVLDHVDQEKRDWIGSRILDLCLHELFAFRVMQTDPNWSNFLYNERTQKIELIDFGASQEYSKEFIDKYALLLSSAVHEDREKSIQYSRDLGYFTGEENEEMISAHLTSLFALALPFRRSSPSPFPFGTLGPQITSTVRAQIPIMLKHRLSPPPEETYSLNRKLSGAFLLCERLESRVESREMYERMKGTRG